MWNIPTKFPKQQHRHRVWVFARSGCHGRGNGCLREVVPLGVRNEPDEPIDQ